MYLVLSSSEIAVECLGTLARFNRVCSGDNKKDAMLELKLTTFTLFFIHHVANTHNYKKLALEGVRVVSATIMKSYCLCSSDREKSYCKKMKGNLFKDQ